MATAGHVTRNGAKGAVSYSSCKGQVLRYADSSTGVYKYRDFRDKIPDGVNPLRTSEPLIYVSSAMARLNAKRSTERLFEFTAMPIPMMESKEAQAVTPRAVFARCAVRSTTSCAAACGGGSTE